MDIHLKKYNILIHKSFLNSCPFIQQISLICPRKLLKQCIDLFEWFNNGCFFNSLYKFILNVTVHLLIFNLLTKVSINSSVSMNWSKIRPSLYAISIIFLFFVYDIFILFYTLQCVLKGYLIISFIIQLKIF